MKVLVVFGMIFLLAVNVGFATNNEVIKIHESKAYINKAKIKFDSPCIKIINIKVYDLSGNIVRNEKGLAQEAYELDGYGLEAGKYYFKVKTKCSEYLGNLVVE